MYSPPYKQMADTKTKRGEVHFEKTFFEKIGFKQKHSKCEFKKWDLFYYFSEFLLYYTLLSSLVE